MKRGFLFTMTFLMLSAAALGQTLNQWSGPWEMEQSGTTADLRGIHAVGRGIAWASGTNGTILRTEDDGYEWQSCTVPPGSEKLDFRGIWAWDNNTAIVMSSGPGDQSRLYKTTDGCAHWTLLYTNPDKDGFWDAMAFESPARGYLLGDPVGGEFAFLITTDGGRSWKRERAESLAASRQSEAAFAASNSELALTSESSGFQPDSLGTWESFGTGGTGGAFVYTDRPWTLRMAGMPGYVGPPRRLGSAWHRATVPLASGNRSSGVFSLAFLDPNDGVAVGGDSTRPDDSTGTAAWSADGGRTWTAAAKPPHGYRSAVAWDADARASIAAGTNGSDISYDDGKAWVALDNSNWNALSLPWIVGPVGRIGKLDAARLRQAKSSQKPVSR